MHAAAKSSTHVLSRPCQLPPPWIGNKSDSFITGEVGIVPDVRMNPGMPNKCFLAIEFEGERYVGCLASMILHFAARHLSSYSSTMKTQLSKSVI
jgi:hypothetical protein